MLRIRMVSALLAATEEFELSPREAEVLSLMARGRTGPYISETLFISQNTTKKHVQHIYRKLDIHSNQEAIDLVEARCRLLSAAFCK